MMKDIEDVHLDRNNKIMYINGITIGDAETYGYFEALPVDTDLAASVKIAIKIGALGMQKMGTTLDIDFINKAFSQFKRDTEEVYSSQLENIEKALEFYLSMESEASALAHFKRDLGILLSGDNVNSPLYRLNETLRIYFDEEQGVLTKLMRRYFDTEEGTLSKLLDMAFDLNNKNSAMSVFITELGNTIALEEGNIRKMLDSNDSGSPTYFLKKELLTQLEVHKENYLAEMKKSIIEIRDALIRESAIAVEKEKGTKKGLEFEDTIFEELVAASQNTSDEVKSVGNIAGVIGKQGDITVDYDGDSSRRAVFECKDSNAYSSNAKAVLKVINESKKNREAAFGVFLFAKEDQMPKNLKPFKINDNYLITSYECCPLYYIYQLVKLCTKKMYADLGNDKIENIATAVSAIKDELRAVSEIKRQLTSNINSAKYVQEHIDTLYRAIASKIDDIERELAK